MHAGPGLLVQLLVLQLLQAVQPAERHLPLVRPLAQQLLDEARVDLLHLGEDLVAAPALHDRARHVVPCRRGGAARRSARGARPRVLLALLAVAPRDALEQRAKGSRHEGSTLLHFAMLPAHEATRDPKARAAPVSVAVVKRVCELVPDAIRATSRRGYTPMYALARFGVANATADRLTAQTVDALVACSKAAGEEGENAEALARAASSAGGCSPGHAPSIPTARRGPTRAEYGGIGSDTGRLWAPFGAR